MTELSPTIPTALVGVDMTKFAKDTITLDENKTFDQNLKDNFGISADQAAEIVNFALIHDIPMTPQTATDVSTQTGGVPLQQLAVVLATIITTMQSGQQAVNFVTSGIALVDSASQRFVEKSKLAESAAVWRKEMMEHCPHVVTPPVQCSYMDLQCKLIDYDKVATEQALFEYNSALCTLATEKYTAAVVGLPAAQRKGVEQAAASFAGVVNLVNNAAIPAADLEKLKKDKILTGDGKVVDEAGYKAYIISKLSPAPAAAAPAAPPAEEAQAKKGGRRKTGKSKRRKRTTFRRPKFVY